MTTDMTVSYVVYPLGSSGYNIFSRATQAEHAGLRFRFKDGKFKEIHYAVSGNSVSEYESTLRPNGSLHKICDIPDEKFESIRNQLFNDFDGKKYVFGKRDCWTFVEYFCETIGVDKASLGGPIGDRSGIGNGVRHLSKQVGSAWLKIRPW